MPDSAEPAKTTLPILTLPPEGFVSQLPAHLLPNDPNMRWLMEEMSKNSQATEFSCRGVIELSQHMRVLNGRTAKAEASLTETKADLAALKARIEPVGGLVKGIGYFAYLWAFLPFRVLFSLGVLAVVLVGYPYYLSHSAPALIAIAKAALGLD